MGSSKKNLSLSYNSCYIKYLEFIFGYNNYCGTELLASLLFLPYPLCVCVCIYIYIYIYTHTHAWLGI